MKKYAVILNEQIHHEGDERSRTNPGHGYPAYTETISTFKPFKTYDEFVDWVTVEKSRVYGSKSFTAIEYEEVKITTSIKINIGT